MRLKTKFKETEIGMIPDGWEETTLGSVVTFQRGHDLPLKNMHNGSYPVVMSSGIGGRHNDFKVKGPGITIGRSGNLGEPFYVEGDYWPHNTTLYIKEYKNANLKFIYYFLKGLKLSRFNAGSAVPTLNRNHIHPIPIIFPKKLDEQKAIAKVLSALDSKIEINQQMNKTLESVGQALFKHWFVDFEFPNENGKPYKSSGADMVDSELGEIPKAWRSGVLGEIIENFDSKRIPLSSRERAKRQGIYPYYGATCVMDYVDDYIFDGQYILMGEDGTVVDGKGYPVLQYVWDKFWVNNHAHILRGKEGVPLEFIFLLLKNTNVTHIVTGAVQPKINQGNMNNVEIVIPSKKILSQFNSIIFPIFASYRRSIEEIKTLSQIRDSLLPRLMSGRIRVKKEKYNG